MDRHPPKFLDRLELLLLSSGKAKSTTRDYCRWVERFIRYHNKRHPKDMGKDEINAFICHIHSDLRLSASAQNQALCALKFCYDKLIGRDIGRLDGLIWSKKPKRLPVVYQPDEVKTILEFLNPPYWLMVYIAFTTGLRISEVLNLTVGNLNFKRRCIRVENGKGGKDREVDMPDDLAPLLTQQKYYAESLYEADITGSSLSGQHFGRVKNYPIRSSDSVFHQPIFAHSCLYVDHQLGCFLRRKFSRQAVSKALKEAMKHAGVEVGSFHHLRHSYATAALASGMNIRYLQQALGHNDVRTTEIYTHILPENRDKVVSPLDKMP